jgi:hypothetical protein
MLILEWVKEVAVSLDVWIYIPSFVRVLIGVFLDLRGGVLVLRGMNDFLFGMYGLRWARDEHAA